jgi:hypothetical protein
MLVGDTVLLFYTDFTLPNNANDGDWLVVREGQIAGLDIYFSNPIELVNDPNGVHFYMDVSQDENGYYWLSTRHGGGGVQNNTVFRSLQPYDFISWDTGAVPIDINVDQSIVPEIIGLEGGKAYAMARVYDSNEYSIRGSFFDGTSWSSDYKIDDMTDVVGDDRRISAEWDPLTKRIHLLYVDRYGDLRHRILNHPYRASDWKPTLNRPGTLVESGPVFAAVLSIDIREMPAPIYAVYGAERYVGSDPRTRSGEIYIKEYNGMNWCNNSYLISEVGEIYNWYPNVNKYVTADDKIGVLFSKGLSAPLEAMFSVVTVNNLPLNEVK